jgi:predicted transcriptional regulator
MAKKRKFDQIRDLILNTIGSDKKTINQIAGDSKINWKTVDRHIIYLIGTGMVKEVFSSPYVKIVELTEKGKEYLGVVSA